VTLVHRVSIALVSGNGYVPYHASTLAIILFYIQYRLYCNIDCPTKTSIALDRMPPCLELIERTVYDPLSTQYIGWYFTLVNNKYKTCHYVSLFDFDVQHLARSHSTVLERHTIRMIIQKHGSS
jgi:hypothetical protein